MICNPPGGQKDPSNSMEGAGISSMSLLLKYDLLTITNLTDTYDGYSLAYGISSSDYKVIKAFG